MDVMEPPLLQQHCTFPSSEIRLGRGQRSRDTGTFVILRKSLLLAGSIVTKLTPSLTSPSLSPFPFLPVDFGRLAYESEVDTAESSIYRAYRNRNVSDLLSVGRMRRRQLASALFGCHIPDHWATPHVGEGEILPWRG